MYADELMTAVSARVVDQGTTVSGCQLSSSTSADVHSQEAR